MKHYNTEFLDYLMRVAIPEADIDGLEVIARYYRLNVGELGELINQKSQDMLDQFIDKLTTIFREQPVKDIAFLGKTLQIVLYLCILQIKTEGLVHLISEVCQHFLQQDLVAQAATKADRLTLT